MSIKISFALMAAVGLAGCDKPASTPSDNKTPPPPPTSSSTPAPVAAPASPAPVASSTPSAEWKTTATGLKYQVLKQGTGTASPKATDTVKVHYHGTFLDGNVFDSSVQRGQPISFPLNRVIKGWTEGLQLMKVGDKFKFEIPSDLAYGEAGRPGIPPNSTLVFEIELLGIE